MPYEPNLPLHPIPFDRKQPRPQRAQTLPNNPPYLPPLVDIAPSLDTRCDRNLWVFRDMVRHHCQVLFGLEASRHACPHHLPRSCKAGQQCRGKQPQLVSINRRVNSFVPTAVSWYCCTGIALNSRLRGWRLVLKVFHISTDSGHGSR